MTGPAFRTRDYRGRWGSLAMTASNSGSALLLAVLLVAIMGIGSTALWRLLHSTLAEGRRYEKSEMALHLAEAGLEKAVAELRSQPDTYRGETDTQLGRGRFSVAVQPGPHPGEYRLESTGKLTDGGVAFARKTLEAELTLTNSGAVRVFHWRVRKR